MDWKPIDYGRFEAKGTLGIYIIFPRKLGPETGSFYAKANRFGAEEEWVVSFHRNDEGPMRWREIEVSTSLDNAKWMADNYDSYRASKNA
jgi:hypothetical protein